jgi:hypothetical protein
VEYATEKWGGRPHYRGPVQHLGDDEHGAWLWGPKGRVIHRGDGTRFHSEQDMVMLIDLDAWWAPCWWFGHAEVELYVNINTPAVWEDHRVVAVDLDLDVIRFHDGRVEIVDRDEFDEHRERFGYPDDVVAATEAAAARALELVAGSEPPFDGRAAAAWAARARSGRPAG